MLSLASDKAILFVENFPKRYYLDDSITSSPAFCFRTALKLHNIPVTHKLFKKVINNPDSSKAPGPDYMPVLILQNYEPKIS